jgi:putative membrane protein
MPPSTPQPQRNPARIREHLANERTYLAWMRTAIALMGFGVVIVRLRYLLPSQLQGQGNGNGWKLGILFAIVGLLTVFLSTAQYFAILKAIESDTYEPTQRWVILFSLATILLGAGVIYFFFTIPASAYPNLN